MNGAMEAIGLDDNEYISARFTAGAEIGENSRASIDTLKATGYMGQANPTKILMKFEAHDLLERLMQYKSKDADKLNEENESIIRYVYRKIKAS